MISQLQACSDRISSSQSDSSWMPFLQFVLSILIYATMHWIVHQNVALLHSWIHPFMNEMKRQFTTSQDQRQSRRSGGSYGMKDRRLVFIPNQTNVIQPNKVDISQSNNECHDLSIKTSESTIITHVPKKDPRFSWMLKKWKRVSDVKHEGNKSSRHHSGSNHYYPLKCHPSRRIQQSRNTNNRHQYQRYPLNTFRNRIENVFDRVALWYYVDRRLQKSR